MTRGIITQGLAPSLSLAPSSSLAPAATIYAGGPITPHGIAMRVGVGGAFVDVSAWVEFGEGITYNYGRATQFDDAQPGTFTFTLNNADGRFTPDNPTSPLGATVTEGTSVLWQLGTRIVAGHVLAVTIPADEASWNHLVVTCDDMLGAAARHWITSIPDALFLVAKGDLQWKLDEASGSSFGAEVNHDPIGPFVLTRSNLTSTTGGVTFGATQVAGLPGTAMTLTAAAGETNRYGTAHGNTVPVSKVHTVAQGAGVGGQVVALGFWSMWVYPGSTINLAIVPKFGTDTLGYAWSAQIKCTPTTIGVQMGSNATLVSNLSAQQQLVPHYVTLSQRLIWQTSGSYWALQGTLFVDSAQVAASFWYDPQHGYTIPQYTDSLAPVEVSLAVTGDTLQRSGTVQRISHSTNGSPSEYLALTPTLEGRRYVLDLITTEINVGVYSTPLSTAPIGFGSTQATTATILDVFNEIIRSEAGHLFAQTTGTFPTSAVETVEFRARDRPLTPKAVFDVTKEGDGLPAFVRDITNVAAQVQVSGPTQNVIVTDPTITGRYITSGLAETILYLGQEDLREWGQDRLQRGKNRAVRANTFSVDAATTPTDRSTDLLGLVPGDRIQLANLPAASLGFTNWDGWLLGGSESHAPTRNQFVFTLAPTLPNSAILDSDLFAAGGDLRIGNTYTSTATSIVFNANYATPVSTVVPYTILIDSEQLTVTSITGSTWTVTRGVNGTTPASHTVGAYAEILPTAVYAY